MTSFKDKEEFADAFFDHVFPEGEDVTDEDKTWFEDHVMKFFDQFADGEGNKPPSRRRQGNSGGSGKPNPPRRRRSASSNDSNSTYGSRTFFGS